MSLGIKAEVCPPASLAGGLVKIATILTSQESFKSAKASILLLIIDEQNHQSV
jgi:hypothetical protein